jgi:hypothetical protein
MKITQRQLRQIIKEELLREADRQESDLSTLTARGNSLRRRAGLFIKNVDALKKNYPEEYSTLTSKHPKFVENEQRVRRVLSVIETSAIAGPTLVTAIDAYNSTATDVNIDIDSLTGDDAMTQAQSEEIAQIANDVYDSLFPESYVSQFVRWSTGQRSLEDYQKWLILPGEGIESAITNLASLLNPETWVSATEGATTLYNMTPEERSSAALAIKLMWDQIPPDRLARDAGRWLLSVIFLCGGLSKFATMTGSIRTTRALELIYLLHNLTKLKALPIAVLQGLRLTPV